MDWSPIFLTLKLATVSTLLLLVIGVPLAWLLARRPSWRSSFVEVLVSMPLVLPPTVIGFYLLLAFSPNNFLGSTFESLFGVRVAFSFTGLVVASILYSLPFMVNPLLSAFRGVPKPLLETAQLLGLSEWKLLVRVAVPIIKRALVGAIVMTFAHTVGEFGVVMMIGGSIPDETRVASIALFEAVETRHYDVANQYALFLVIFSAATLFVLYLFVNKKGRQA